MKTHSINFFNDFNCIAAECQNSCCKGWLVLLDDETVRRYEEIKGLDGIKLRLARGKKYGNYVFNKNTHNCPFWDKDRLCYLQKKYGHDYLCKVCRDYPRIYYNYGFCAEEYLDLSCPEAMRLFMSNIDKIDYVLSDKPPMTEKYGTNDDKNYFEFLIYMRETIINSIDRKDLSLGQIYYYLIEIGREVQEIFMYNSFEGSPNSLNNADNKPKGFEELSTDPIKLCRERLGCRPSENTPTYSLDIQEIDKIVTKSIYHKRLKTRSGLMYKLCRDYFKTFDKMNIEDINDILKNIYNYIPVNDMDRILRQYLKYLIMTSFLETFEDYCFLRKLSIPIVRTSMLSMFLYIYGKDKKVLTNEDIIGVVSALHRRGSFEEDIVGIILNLN